jgi:hypothetical protein
MTQYGKKYVNMTVWNRSHMTMPHVGVFVKNNTYYNNLVATF